jgi:quinol monooxygenase YgiN
LAVVRHDVEDFDTWRKGYEEFADVQNSLGVKEKSVHRDPTNPNSVLVLHSFESVDAAHKFLTDPRLAEKMKSAGVMGEPRIEVYDTIVGAGAGN